MTKRLACSPLTGTIFLGTVNKNGNVVDIGGNINTLTSLRPSPLAKGNPQHTNLVEVRKA